MNIAELSDNLKGVPDDYLVKHVQQPDGTVPQFMALSELQRRQDMRQRFAANPPTTTVADDILAKQPANPTNPTLPLPSAGASGGGGSGLPSGNGLQPNSGGIAAGAPQGYSTGGSIWGDEDWKYYTPRIQSFEGQNSYTSQNPHSSARGAYQFTRGTYKQYAKKAGVNPDDWSPEAQDKVFKAFTEDNLDTLKKNDISPTATNAYTTHFLGGTGGVSFLKALEKNPSMPVSEYEHFNKKNKNGKSIRDINPAIFKNSKTLGDVYAKMEEVGGHGPSVKQAPERSGAYLANALTGASAIPGGETAQDAGTASTDWSSWFPEVPSIFAEAKAAGYGGGQRPGGISANDSMGGVGPIRYLTDQAEGAAQDIANEGPWKNWLGVTDPEASVAGIGARLVQTIPVGTALGASLVASGAGEIADRAQYLFTPKKDYPSNVAKAKEAQRISQGLQTANRPDFVSGGPQNPGNPYGFQENVRSPSEESTGAANIDVETIAGVMEHAASVPENQELSALTKQLADLYKSQITSKEDMRSMALLQAGLGIAAGESPYFATNVGRGAQAGIESWNAAQKGNSEATSNYAQLLQRQAEVSAAGRRADRGLDIQQQQADISADRALAYTQNMAMKGTGQNKVVAQGLLAHHNLIDKMLVEEVDGQGMPLTPERKQRLQEDLYNTKAKMRDFQSSSSGATGGFDFDPSDSANGGIG